MSQESGKNYVMTEELSHTEKQERNHGGEILTSFHHNISHLDMMIKKINTLESNAIKNTDITSILNILLHKNHLGGKNEGPENKAYFKKYDGQIVLVLNTVVNGKKLDNIGDIAEILDNIDKTLIENPLHSKTSKEKKESTAGEKLQQSQKRLMGFARQIQEINSSYSENINDWFMLRDTLTDMTGGESGKKIYQDQIRSLQKNLEQEYRSFIVSLIGLELTPEDEKTLARYKKQMDSLLKEDLKEVQSFAHYFITEKKLDSVYNVGYAMKGMGEGAIEALTGTVVFIFLLATKPEIRDAVSSSIGSFYDYLKENYSNYEKLWGDFCATFDKEFKKFEGLPNEQKAEAIGKITGNVMATILGAKGMNMAIKSGKLRLKFKAPEEITSIKAPQVFKTVKETHDNTKTILKKSKKTGDRIKEVEIPKKTITNIEEVKNWTDLENFVSTIDRVRFKEGLTGKVLQEMIDEVKQGTRNIKDIPDYGGIRDVVDNLKKFGGVMPEAKGIQKITQQTGEILGKGVQNIQDMIPFKDAQKLLHKGILTGYDIIDINITKLRTLISDKVVFTAIGTSKILHLKEMKDTTVQIMESMKTVSFPGKQKTLDILGGLNKSLEETITNISNKTESFNKKYFVKEGDLTKKEFKALRFEEGFAIREIEKDGKTFYEYRDVNGNKVLHEDIVDGKKVSVEYTYAGHFEKGEATVEATVAKIVNGKEINCIIDTKGNIISGEISKASFGSIQRFKGGGYKIFNGEHYQLKFPDGHKSNKSQYYTFMTEIQCDMVVGVDKKGVKYIINNKGNRIKTPFHYVDDFTEEGVAAVKNKIPDGKWLLVDKEGNVLGADGKIIRLNKDLITKDKNGNYIDVKGDSKTLEDAVKQEQEFETLGYKDNLGALKAHTDALYKKNNPEVVKRIEMEAGDLLKKYHIDTTGASFIHTKQEGILLFQDSVGGTRIVNLEKKSVSKETFSFIHTPDIDNGFIRVSPMNNNEVMGVIDLNGDYIIDPKYVDIQLHDEEKRLFKVFEMRKIGETLKDGTVIEKHYTDVLEDGTDMVKRIGLTDGRGNTIIETGWTEISQSNDIMAQGFIRGEKFEILQKSKQYNTERYSINTTNIGSRGADNMAMLFIAGAESPAILEKSRSGSLNVMRNETSTIISELKNNNISLLINGTLHVNNDLPLHLQSFIKNKVPTLRTVQELEKEITQIVHKETKESTKIYLEKNGLRKLTKPERNAVADYEIEIRKKILGEIHIQVQNEQVLYKNIKGNKKENFVNTLVDNFHPDLYEALGGVINNRSDMLNLAA